MSRLPLNPYEVFERDGEERETATVETAKVKVRRCDWCECLLDFRGNGKWVCENEGCEVKGRMQ